MDTGVLLPVASLPEGNFKSGYPFIDYLAKNGHRYWQVLPLAPRDDYGSPYNSTNSLQIDKNYGKLSEWLQLKRYANNQGIKIIGDLPYFISRQERNDLFVKGLYAGSPPDQYTKKGQYWGLPVYDWVNKFSENMAYILKRFEAADKLYDALRIDHFRGYCAVWAIPKPYKTGKRGSWLPIPGEKIMAAVRKAYPDKLFIAEDLGVITPDVEALRRKFKLLGSQVLIWDEISQMNNDSVLYSSVHDSNTLRGVLHSKIKARHLMAAALETPAKITIFAMQDILGLGSSARLNHPGKIRGNWQWRISYDDLRT